jgi:hypothetical protein
MTIGGKEGSKIPNGCQRFRNGCAILLTGGAEEVPLQVVSNERLSCTVGPGLSRIVDHNLRLVYQHDHSPL